MKITYPFTQAEVNKITTVNTDNIIEIDPLTLTILTGIRISELLSISLSNIDFENKLYIKKSVVRRVFANTEREVSYRCINLLKDTLNKNGLNLKK